MIKWYSNSSTCKHYGMFTRYKANSNVRIFNLCLYILRTLFQGGTQQIVLRLIPNSLLFSPVSHLFTLDTNASKNYEQEMNPLLPLRYISFAFSMYTVLVLEFLPEFCQHHTGGAN